jgi:hypothetical protein
VLKSRCAWASGTHSLALDLLEVAELHHPARRLQVVEDRLVADEALEPHDLFGQERAVVAELNVPLSRNGSESLVEGHRETLARGEIGKALADRGGELEAVT